MTIFNETKLVCFIMIMQCTPLCTQHWCHNTQNVHINDTIQCRAVARGAWGALTPLLEKRSSKIDPFTLLILRIFCIFLTLFNIIIPKIFQPHFAWYNFISQLFDFLFMHIQNFCWGLQEYKPGYPLFVYT